MKEDNTTMQKSGRIGACMARYGLGRNAMISLAKEAKAEIQIGVRTKIYDMEKIDKYLEEKSK